MTEQTLAEFTPDMLQLKRRYSARRDLLWRAWTEPERIKQWLSSSEWVLEKIALDLRAGGDYHFFFRSPEGKTSEVFGKYETVEAPSLLVFTWFVTGECGDVANTRVCVEFIERADGTEMRLRHERFASRTDRNNHLTGWLECMDRFVDLPASMMAQGAG